MSNVSIIFIVLDMEQRMKETTALNQISRIVDQLRYKSVYIEIETDNDKYTLERQRSRKIGFDTGGKR